jgi:hypothetical protein
MTQWQKTYTRETPKTKTEVREMLTEAVRCINANHAIAVAELLASGPHYVGAWAFSRTGDLATGWFEDPEVLARFGGF